MGSKSIKQRGRGPFRPEQLRPGDPDELSNGHPVGCLPFGGGNSRANLVGGLTLATGPAVDSAGVDTGYVADDYTLRAPDLAVGNVPDAPGWVKAAPPLAVEYDDTGQDEWDLPVKIRQLLGAGTRLAWMRSTRKGWPWARLRGRPKGGSRPYDWPYSRSWRARGLTVDAELQRVIAATRDRDLLTQWLWRAAVCADGRSLLDPP